MITESSATPAAPACPQHPGTAATYICTRCQSAVCIDCCYTMTDDSICCKTCFQTGASSAGAPSAPVAASVSEPAAMSVSPLPALKLRVNEAAAQSVPVETTPLPAAQGCVQHPNVRPVAQCKLCGARVCRTCDFAFPGNLHLCPACAVAGRAKLSPRRKKYLITAYVMAVWSSFAMVALMLGAVAGLTDGAGAEMLAGLLVIGLVAVPAVVGTGMSMSTMCKGANTMSIWIALVWNALMLGGIMLLSILGQFAEN